MIVKLLQIILFIVFLLDLFFVWKGETQPRFFTKTLLLPLLIFIYVASKKEINRLFFVGLIFSFLGDVFLLFDWGFLAGLRSFLLAHIFYIFAFKKNPQKKISEIWFIGVSLYVAILVVFLFPYLKEMKVPVVLYAIIIGLMFLNALKTQNKLLILGAFCFIVSDSLLAFNLFVYPDKLLSILVMCTYVFAQWMLVQGMISKNIQQS